MKAVTICIVVGVCTVLAAVITDCSSGNSKSWDCRVLSKQYKAPYTTTTASTDSDGQIHVETFNHPEEFHVFVVGLENEVQLDVNTTAIIYHTVTNGQMVKATARVGRWSKINYVPTIEP